MQNDITSIRNKCDETNSMLDQRFYDMSSKIDLQHFTDMGMLSSINVDNSDLFDTRLYAQFYADSLKHELRFSDMSLQMDLQHITAMGMFSSINVDNSDSFDTRLDAQSDTDSVKCELKHERELELESQPEWDPRQMPGREPKREPVPKQELEHKRKPERKPGRKPERETKPELASADDCIDSGRLQANRLSSETDINIVAIDINIVAIGNCLEAINQRMAAAATTCNEIGPEDINHTEVDLDEIGSDAIHRTKVGSKENDPEAISRQMMCPGETGPAAMTRPAVGPEEIDPGAMTLTRNAFGLDEIGLAAISRNAIGPEEINPEIINHADVTSSDCTTLDLVSMLHTDVELHNVHSLFTDISRRLMTQAGLGIHSMHFLLCPWEIDPDASVRTEFGPEEIGPAAIIRTAFGTYQPREFCPQLEAQQFRSGVAICSEIHMAIKPENTENCVVSGPEIGPAIEADIRNYVFQEPDILSSDIGSGDCSSFDPHLSVVGPVIVPDAATHHGWTSSNSTTLDFVSTLHVDSDLDSLHIIFTDWFGNQTGARKQDDTHSIQKLDGVNRILLIHADLEKRNMHFTFTDISGRLLTFQMLVRHAMAFSYILCIEAIR